MSFTYTRKLNYYETDRMGVIHHSNYIRFLEEARCEWLDINNISMSTLEANQITIPTLEVNVKYKNHVTSGDTITITPKISDFNGVRMTITYDVIDVKTGKTVIEAETKHCFTDINLRPINLKKHNEDFFNTFVGLI